MSLTYPHCHHCCWNNEHHVETHETPCWSGCSGATPVEPGLFDPVAPPAEALS